MRKKFVYLISFFMVMILVSSASVTFADVVAYWRFDDVGDADIEQWGPVAAGNPLPDSDGLTVWRKAIHDHSGNGNYMTTWEYAWGGFDWSSDVPVATVPLTGSTNALSIVNTGSWPAAFTWSSMSNPSGIDAQLITPAQFTVEASFKANELGGFRTIVGRDGQNVWTEPVWDPFNWAPFYLSVRPDNQVAVEFVDVSGYQYTVESAPGIVTTGQWYHIAAVSDGSTLSLYLDNVLVGDLDITTKGSPDTSLANGAGSSGPDWTGGTWTLARGLWGGGHVDRWFGYLDEVRISDAALSPSEFLMVPEPATIVLLGLGFLTLVRRRKS